MVTVCTPYAAVEETVKVPVRTPLLSIVHEIGGVVAKADDAPPGISLMSLVQVAGPVRYPEPEKLPELPGAPLGGVMAKVD
jgi:hypothetical protein